LSRCASLPVKFPFSAPASAPKTGPASAPGYDKRVKLLRVICFLAPGLLLAQPAADPVSTARKAVDLLLGEKYPDLFQMFSPDMQKSIPEAQLAKIGAQCKNWGALESLGQAESRRAGLNTVVIIPGKFASQNINFQLAVNRAGQLAGMVFLPGESVWQHPPYSKPDSFRERQLTIGVGDWPLPAILTLPNGNGPFPGVVLVHGSGPNDRDETVFANKPFKDLAEGLASRGIAVLRYEKRTRQYQSKMAGMARLTVQEETVDDAAKAAVLLRQQKEVNPEKIYVLGHSMGGYLAPRIATEDGKLAGIIILAGHARPLEDLILEQVAESGSKQLETAKIQVARIKALEDADSDAPPILNLPVSYWLDLKGYDPVAVAKKLSLRILVIQGERDFQVPMKDYELWKSGLAGKRDATFQSFPTLNHLFVPGEGKSSEAEYRKPGHVAPEVIDLIAKWITG
jgi:dienelactone hydrolase